MLQYNNKEQYFRWKWHTKRLTYIQTELKYYFKSIYLLEILGSVILLYYKCIQEDWFTDVAIDSNTLHLQSAVTK